MLTQKAKELFSRLNCEFQPVAIKYCYSQPKEFEHIDELLSFCEFAKKAAVEDRAFFTTKDDEESKAEMRRRMDAWQEMSPDFILKK